MGAVFTIALFFPLAIPIFILETLGIDASGAIENFADSVRAWLEANPESAAEIGNILKSVFSFIAKIAEKLS